MQGSTKSKDGRKHRMGKGWECYRIMAQERGIYACIQRFLCQTQCLGYRRIGAFTGLDRQLCGYLQASERWFGGALVFMGCCLVMSLENWLWWMGGWAKVGMRGCVEYTMDSRYPFIPPFDTSYCVRLSHLDCSMNWKSNIPFFGTNWAARAAGLKFLRVKDRNRPSHV